MSSGKRQMRLDRVEDLEEQVDALENEIERINQNTNGAVANISKLIDRLDDVEALVEEFDARLQEVEAAADLDLEQKQYEDLSKPEKARRIQVALIKEAESTPHGKAAMTYRDVKFLFNSRPSAGHVYDLMDLAGGAAGFEYQERDADDNRLTVDLEAVNDSLRVHAMNNSSDSGGS